MMAELESIPGTLTAWWEYIPDGTPVIMHLRTRASHVTEAQFSIANPRTDMFSEVGSWRKTRPDAERAREQADGS